MTTPNVSPIAHDGPSPHAPIVNVASDPRYCPVCRHGETGYCDERCETREPNGRPGHFAC